MDPRGGGVRNDRLGGHRLRRRRMAWRRRLLDRRLLSAVGFNLMLQYGLNYLFGMHPAPWPIAIAGSVLAIALIGVQQKWLYRRPGGSPRILMVGTDAVAEALSGPLAERIAGKLERFGAIWMRPLPPSVRLPLW